MEEAQGFVVVGAIVLFAAFIAGRPSSVENKDPVKEGFPRFHLLRGENDADGTLEISGSLDGRTGRIVVDRGMLYEPKEGEPDKLPNLKLKFTPDYYLIDPGFDCGTWAGYYDGARNSNTDTFQVGVRASPVRLGYGILSPDAVISRDAIGAGVSVYAPERWARDFHHLGVGAWYVYPMGSSDGAGNPGWAFGLSFSIR